MGLRAAADVSALTLLGSDAGLAALAAHAVDHPPAGIVATALGDALSRCKGRVGGLFGLPPLAELAADAPSDGGAASDGAHGDVEVEQLLGWFGGVAGGGGGDARRNFEVRPPAASASRSR